MRRIAAHAGNGQEVLRGDQLISPDDHAPPYDGPRRRSPGSSCVATDRCPCTTWAMSLPRRVPRPRSSLLESSSRPRTASVYMWTAAGATCRGGAQTSARATGGRHPPTACRRGSSIPTRGPPLSLEYCATSTDGLVGWARGWLVPATDHRGEVIAYVGSIQCVTDLARSEARLRQLAEDPSNAIVRSTARGKITYVSLDLQDARLPGSAAHRSADALDHPPRRPASVR